MDMDKETLKAIKGIDKETLKAIKNLEKLMSSKIRVMIIGLLGNKEHPKATISQIHEGVNHELKHKYDYKAIHKQIKLLEKWKIVKLKRFKKEQGSPVYVELTNLFWYEVVVGVIKEELKIFKENS